MKGVLFVVDPGFRQDPMAGTTNLFQLPLYDQPAIFYCLANFLEYNIPDLLLVGDAASLGGLRPLLGDGGQYGMRVSYREEEKPEALLSVLQDLGEYIADQPVCISLAHNFFWGDDLGLPFATPPQGARIFASQQQTCEEYAVLNLEDGNWRVADLGFYEPGVVALAASLDTTGRPSYDLELLARSYAARGSMDLIRWPTGLIWFDVRDLASLWEAARQAETIEMDMEQKAVCLEELALQLGRIDAEQCRVLCERYGPGPYREYLRRMFIRSGLLPEERRGLRLAD